MTQALVKNGFFGYNKGETQSNQRRMCMNSDQTYSAHEELILVVDDEQDIRSLLRILLEKEGWGMAEAANGQEAVDFVKHHGKAVSLVILDIMMPVMNGTQAATAIREMTQAPILFLTARSSDSDKILAYRSGADDFIVKPFHATDLRLKIRAMLTRYAMYRAQEGMPKPVSDGGQTCIIGQNIEVHFEQKTVTKDGQKITLTDREFELLKFFCQHKNQTLTPAMLYEAVWGETYLSTASNTVIVHIANLRKKLEQGISGSAGIRTVWGKGYRLE